MARDVQSIFQVSGDSAQNDPLGLWGALPVASETVHFGIDEAPASPPPDVQVFRVNLPEDFASANAAMNAGEAQLLASSRALESVPARLDDLVQRTLEREQAASKDGAVSFDTQALSSQETGAEADLLTLMGDVEIETKAANSGDQVHFGVGDQVSDAWVQAKTQFDGLMDTINREVLHFAWVETNISGLLMARTMINWSGDSQTICTEGIESEQIELHKRTLNIAVSTRSMRLKLFTTVASGAVKISSLLATPGAAVLALPATYKYVTQIIAQVKQYQSIQSN